MNARLPGATGLIYSTSNNKQASAAAWQVEMQCSNVDIQGEQQSRCMRRAAMGSPNGKGRVCEGCSIVSKHPYNRSYQHKHVYNNDDYVNYATLSYVDVTPHCSHYMLQY